MNRMNADVAVVWMRVVFNQSIKQTNNTQYNNARVAPSLDALAPNAILAAAAADGRGEDCAPRRAKSVCRNGRA